jgi:tRNA-dihydrouridine synthase B
MALNAIKIHNLTINPPVFLAPLAGITDGPFRRIVKKFPVGMVFSEMLSTQAVVRENKKTLKMAKFYPEERPFAIQIMGSNPEFMRDSAMKFQDLGASIIDINMGCPQSKVIKTFSGAALLKDLKLAEIIIKQVKKSIKIPLSIKIRLGWDEKSFVHTEIARIAEDNGVDLITVHGRTRSQFFSGQANWEEIKKVKERVKIPVIANGDIISPETAKKCLESSQADGIMVGRGAIGRPWLFDSIVKYLQTGEISPEPSNEEKFFIITEHLNNIESHYNYPISVFLSRKHAAWHTKRSENGSAIRDKIHRATSINEIRDLLKSFFYSA